MKNNWVKSDILDKSIIQEEGFKVIIPKYEYKYI